MNADLDKAHESVLTELDKAYRALAKARREYNALRKAQVILYRALTSAGK